MVRLHSTPRPPFRPATRTARPWIQLVTPPGTERNISNVNAFCGKSLWQMKTLEALTALKVDTSAKEADAFTARFVEKNAEFVKKTRLSSNKGRDNATHCRVKITAADVPAGDAPSDSDDSFSSDSPSVASLLENTIKMKMRIKINIKIEIK